MDPKSDTEKPQEGDLNFGLEEVAGAIEGGELTHRTMALREGAAFKHSRRQKMGA